MSSYGETLRAGQLSGLHAAYEQSLVPRTGADLYMDEPRSASGRAGRVRCAHTFDITVPACRACSGADRYDCNHYEPVEVMV